MEKKGKVSVVIPVYNGERYLKYAIESALKQTVKPDEIIVVDDASTDNTEQVVKEFKDIKVFYIKNETNKERAFCRNRGVELARGEYVFFLDYDDMWKPDYIQDSLHFLEDGFDIVYSIPRDFLNEKGYVFRTSKKKIPNEQEKIIFSALIGYPSATAVRKNSFIKYADKYIPREDWEFFIRAYLSGQRIKVLDNRKVLIREHNQRTSRNIKFLYSTLKVYDDYIDSIPDEFVSDFTLHVALICLRFGNLFEGWKLALSAIKNKPSIIFSSRNFINIIKWGVRIDRFLNYIKTGKVNL